MALTDTDLPGVWKNADGESRRGQTWTLRLTWLKVGGGVLAAFGGALSWSLGSVDVAAGIVLVGFLTALVSELVSWVTQPERLWYEGRAVAESAKTLAWRYAVGADPFPASMSRTEAASKFSERMSAVADQVAERIIFDEEQPVLTEPMDALRARPFEERRAAYIQFRTQDQQQWYSRKARANRRQAAAWRFILILAEVIAVVLAAGRVFGGWSVDFAGLLAALIAACTAWVAVKQFSPLASAYSVATKELSLQSFRLSDVAEDDWPLVAADAEEAISREHTTWLASRTGSATIRPGS
ncbi:DUF4231 domain-containing protein [Arthrobacter cryoconiti]|uniref:DUF4231 domain-containing protein n=1 Tax=Arthrobacter cryoconiti TaxID=748907 RepID=A0ABV8QZL3_9MICC|nr:DUF4231 domain-containing protein [Arthrobacter cryoconiti]MCC9068268.1 DUF4231 domain-containing protein [Arthrobacter cryoconiti]